MHRIVLFWAFKLHGVEGNRPHEFPWWTYTKSSTSPPVACMKTWFSPRFEWPIIVRHSQLTTSALMASNALWCSAVQVGKWWCMSLLLLEWVCKCNLQALVRKVICNVWAWEMTGHQWYSVEQAIAKSCQLWMCWLWFPCRNVVSKEVQFQKIEMVLLQITI